ncbi:hypothetical protein DFH09DRAFT_1340756 [Mycena vulgaris]|nr:hypothetical protein DFH09DRAFT_1340756 [Mycena vulgaris]
MCPLPSKHLPHPLRPWLHASDADCGGTALMSVSSISIAFPSKYLPHLPMLRSRSLDAERAGAALGSADSITTIAPLQATSLRLSTSLTRLGSARMPPMPTVPRLRSGALIPSHYRSLQDDYLSPSQTTAKRVPAKKRKKAKTKRILDVNTNTNTNSNADTDGLSKPAAKSKSDSKWMAKMSTQLDVEMDTAQSVSESESDTDLDPENLQAVDDENIESEDSDGDIPVIDLTGDDELQAPNAKNENTPVQGIRRDTKGNVIYCHSLFSQKVPEFTFRAWLK